MTIIESVKNYIKTNPTIDNEIPVWVDFIGEKPGEIGIIPLPGNKIEETYLDGTTIRIFRFAIQSMESTADELTRLENSGFYEQLSDWFETQTEAGTLPTLDTGKTALEIETLGWGYLLNEGQSETGIYQVQCALRYRQAANEITGD